MRSMCASFKSVLKWCELRRDLFEGMLKTLLNTDKTKNMVFFSKDTSAIPTFTNDGTPLELVNHFKYLGFDSLSLVMEVCTQQLIRWQTT